MPLPDVLPTVLSATEPRTRNARHSTSNHVPCQPHATARNFPSGERQRAPWPDDRRRQQHDLPQNRSRTAGRRGHL